MKRRLLGTLNGHLKRAACFAALFICAGSASAEDARIVSNNGGLELVGRLLDFDGTYLQVASQHGAVTVLYDNVTCEGADCPVDGAFVPRVRLTAVSEIADVLLPGLTQRFATMNGLRARTDQGADGHLVMSLEDQSGPIARFDIRAASAEESFADLVSLEADIILSRREISEAESEMAEEALVAKFDEIGQNMVIGYDALIPVVSPSRDVGSISPRGLLEIFRGNVSDWSELGSDDGPIRLQLAVDAPAFGVQARAGAVKHADFETAVAVVVSDPNALGMVSFQKSGFSQQIDLVDTCGFVATPDQSAIKTGDYPLTVPIYLYHADRRMPEIVTEFLEWLPSPQAQLVVRRSGFVDAGLLPIPLDMQGQRFVNAIQSADGPEDLVKLQELTLDLAERTRLSMSFRFRPGGSDLDASSRAQLLRLVQSIEDGAFDGRTILLVGFSDGQGSAELNQNLSERRADAVSRALLENLSEVIQERLNVETVGFGEVLPVGCDDTAWGRQQNRRVELWVGD